MGPKSKRGQKVSLAEFGGLKGTEEDLDWAADGDFNPEDDKPVVTGIKPKPKAERPDHSFKSGTMEKNFRDLPQERPSKFVDLKMAGPFIAQIGNLSHDITKEILQDQFEGVTRCDVMQNKATFAYVEFASAEQLHLCILMDGAVVMKRPMRIDVASDDQRQRGLGGRSGGGGDRGGIEAPVPPVQPSTVILWDNGRRRRMGPRTGPR
jgi:hypothetical protein